jgi:hypothetical protein
MIAGIHKGKGVFPDREELKDHQSTGTGTVHNIIVPLYLYSKWIFDHCRE